MIARLAAAALIAWSCAAAADAASRRRGAKAPGAEIGAAHAPGRTGPASLKLENKRFVSLLEFEVILPGTPAPEEARIVARLAEPLAAGRSVELPLGGSDSCRYEVRWRYDDVEDAGAVDLCKDAHIVLTD
ncbi:MAG TPA: hypothetical protein VIG55_08815 [Methylosinus sp.]|jgi:hypothetical protein